MQLYVRSGRNCSLSNINNMLVHNRIGSLSLDLAVFTIMMKLNTAATCTEHGMFFLEVEEVKLKCQTWLSITVHDN